MRHLFSEWNRLVGSIRSDFPFTSHHVLDIKMIAWSPLCLSHPAFNFCVPENETELMSWGTYLKLDQPLGILKCSFLECYFLKPFIFFQKKKSPKVATDEHHQQILSTVSHLWTSQITKLTKSSDGWLPNWHSSDNSRLRIKNDQLTVNP